MTVPGLLSTASVVLAVGLALQPVVLRLMTAVAVMDRPSARSSHTVPTPRGGGIAVVVAAATGLMLAPPLRAIAVPLLLFAAIGLVEDLRGLAVTTRLTLQAGAGVAAGLLLAPAALALPAKLIVVLVAALWLCAYVNAFNFMDGVNGISAVHAALAGSVYVLAGLAYGIPALVGAGAVIAAAAVAFLPWNAGRARIFLGDVGSYGLGAVLGTVAGYGLLRGVPPEVAVAPLALYLADTGGTLARRCWRGERWYRPHRMHIYQRLTDAGWSHQRVTAATALVSAAVCACAWTAAQSPLPTRIALDAAVVSLLGVYLAAPQLIRLRTSRPRERRRVYA